MFIKAADHSYCNCLSRAVPFNRAINLRNQMGDEIDKKKAFWYPITAEALDICDDI